MNPEKNVQITKESIGYVSRHDASPSTYKKLGFKSGLEIHQQITTKKKLFCNCPAGIYHNKDDYNAEVVRHMRPTLSELGEYDGTALMEFKTRKNIFYHINYQTACTYEIDDTPPFLLNMQALKIALKIAALLKSNIVGEFHITRKQYLDGSIPTGFQRTGIVGIEGDLALSSKNIRIIQLSLEEDACREVSDIGHDRIYVTDRLGIPLIEIVTYPDMKNPDEVAEAAQYLRFTTRSTGLVNTGIGAAREDVNVSISGGTRVEIKGVAQIKWIPELTHNEAFRQKALLEIKKLLDKKIKSKENWNIEHTDIHSWMSKTKSVFFQNLLTEGFKIVAVNLPEFKNLLSFFTSPARTFADEISDRLTVIACITKPNMTSSESIKPVLSEVEFDKIRSELKSKSSDAQIVFWGLEEDIKTALETIEERCRLAFEGVPNETRKSMPDGTTVFKRVLPGPDRMYPDTDSAPVSINEKMVTEAESNLPVEINTCIAKMKEWNVPEDCFRYILKKNLFPLLETVISQTEFSSSFCGAVIGHHIRHLDKKFIPMNNSFRQKIITLLKFVNDKKLSREIIKEMITHLSDNFSDSMESVLSKTGYIFKDKEEITSKINPIKDEFRKNSRSKNPGAEKKWIMGQLRPEAIGNIDLSDLGDIVEEKIND